MALDHAEKPNTFPWPPVLLIALILLTGALHRMFPLVLADLAWLRLVGGAIVILALAIDVWVALIFRRHRTTILPHKGSRALVTEGPFQYSRNPIYLGNVAIMLGVALTSNSWWPVMGALVLFVLVQELAIKREEAHLSALFGEAWTVYAKRVRRWL